MNLKCQDVPWAIERETRAPGSLRPARHIVFASRNGTSRIMVASFYSRAIAEYVVEAHNARLGTGFARWLEDSGFTVRGLASALGVSRSSVYGWLNGGWAPGEENLAKLHELSGGAVTAALWS